LLLHASGRRATVTGNLSGGRSATAVAGDGIIQASGVADSEVVHANWKRQASEHFNKPFMVVSLDHRFAMPATINGKDAGRSDYPHLHRANK
jgi:hypothetical protein